MWRLTKYDTGYISPSVVVVYQLRKRKLVCCPVGIMVATKFYIMRGFDSLPVEMKWPLFIEVTIQ